MPIKNVGIDLGTANVTVFVEGKGIVLHEKNAAAFDTRTHELLLVGDEAYALLDRAPDTLELCRPMQNGVISDFSVMQKILSLTIETVCGKSVFRPNVVITVPDSLTMLEKRTILKVAVQSGAGKVCLLDATIAAALGAGIGIDEPHGVMMIDIGAGTADVSLITMGTVAYSTALRTAGEAMDEAIQSYLRWERGFLVGLPTAERVKMILGCAVPRSEEVELLVNGKNAVTGAPESKTVTSTEICKALREPVTALTDGILAVLEQTPPELYTDVCSEGITLTGGGSLLHGLADAIKARLKIKARTVFDGEHCAAKGAGLALGSMRTLEDHGYLFRLKSIGQYETGR